MTDTRARKRTGAVERLLGREVSKAEPAPVPHAEFPGDYLTRDETLARLGVKRSTLYTYVSRGLIRSVPRREGRGNLFSRDDVDRIRARGEAHAGKISHAQTVLRRGAPLVTTRITELTPSGPRYRGRDVVELARMGCSFEAVAQLLWNGTLDDESLVWGATPLAAISDSVWTKFSSSMARGDVWKIFGTVVGHLGIAAQGSNELTDGTTGAVGQRILQTMVQCCGFLGPTHRSVRIRPQTSIAANLGMSLGVPARSQIACPLNFALVLCADHELSPAALAARVVASTGADLYACVAAGIAAHSGVQTGRGCNRVEELLGDKVDRSTLMQKLNTVKRYGVTLFGFNNPIYPNGDPRAIALLELAKAYAGPGDPAHDILWFLAQAERECGAQPGLAVSLVTLCSALGLPRHSAAALWTIGRTAGMIAHVIEERRDGFLMRPLARYVGRESER